MAPSSPGVSPDGIRATEVPLPPGVNNHASWKVKTGVTTSLSVRNLLFPGNVITTEVGVGANLLGPYPAGQYLKKVEFLVPDRKGKYVKIGSATGAELALHPQYYTRPLHTLKLNKNVPPLAAGTVVCVHAHIKGVPKPPTGGKSDPPGNHDIAHSSGESDSDKGSTHTEHLTACQPILYAANVGVVSIDHPDEVSFFDRPPLVATVSETMGYFAVTFDCVLTVNGTETERLTDIALAAGGEGVCEFEYRFPRAGEFDVQVSVQNIRPGDANSANDAAAMDVNVIIVIEDPDGGPPVGGGDVILPFFYNYSASERYDTTFKRVQWTYPDGTIADSGFVEFHVRHDSQLEAYWDAQLEWPLVNLRVAHKTAGAIFDNQSFSDVQASGGDETGQCFVQTATSTVFGFTLCTFPMGSRPGWVAKLDYSHTFRPDAPVRVDVVPGVIGLFTGEVAPADARSLVTGPPLAPEFTGNVPAYGGNMDFVIFIKNATGLPLVSGAGFELETTQGVDDSRWLTRTRGACTPVPNPDGTLFATRCEWRYSIWGAKSGAGSIGDF